MEHLAVLPTPRIAYSQAALEGALQSPRRDEIIAQARTVLLDHRPIAAWGVWRYWEGVFSSWAWITPECAGQLRPLLRLAREGIAEAQAKLDAERIQAEVSCDLPGGLRFAELIGFELEGRLRKFGLRGQGDFWMLSIIR